MDCYPKFIDFHQKGFKIIYLDETIFKAYHVTDKAWAPAGENLTLTKEGIKLNT